jgi:hypothetical protein
VFRGCQVKTTISALFLMFRTRAFAIKPVISFLLTCTSLCSYSIPSFKLPTCYYISFLISNILFCIFLFQIYVKLAWTLQYISLHRNLLSIILILNRTSPCVSPSNVLPKLILCFSCRNGYSLTCQDFT